MGGGFMKKKGVLRPILLSILVSIGWWELTSLTEWYLYFHNESFWNYYALIDWKIWLVRMITVLLIFYVFFLRRAMQYAQLKIKILEGLVPVCSWCKNKVRNDAGNWQNMDEYMSGRSGVSVTHSICPECMEETLKTLDKKS